MAYDIFRCYGLDKIHDSFTESYDYKDNDAEQWKLVKRKEVQDSDGFLTEYSWYTNGTKHIFMFGDSDLYEPDEDYADWETESEQEATEWFDSYNGFEDDEELSFENDDDDNIEYSGNADFMNEGFNRVFVSGELELED